MKSNFHGKHDVQIYSKLGTISLVKRVQMSINELSSSNDAVNTLLNSTVLLTGV